MAPAVINNEVRERAKAVVAYARMHRQNIHDMMRLLKASNDGMPSPLGNDRNRRFAIPVGFSVVYSIEQHGEDWFHHISMSSNDPGHVPIPAAVNFALEAMDLPFTHVDALETWVENLP